MAKTASNPLRNLTSLAPTWADPPTPASSITSHRLPLREASSVQSLLSKLRSPSSTSSSKWVTDRCQWAACRAGSPRRRRPRVTPRPLKGNPTPRTLRPKTLPRLKIKSSRSRRRRRKTSRTRMLLRTSTLRSTPRGRTSRTSWSTKL